jgi:hypothetical protein
VYLLLVLDKAAQLGERDPKTGNVVRESPAPPLGVPQEDPAAQLLHICRGPRSGPGMVFGWWFNLYEPPWAQVSWFCRFACGVLDPSCSFNSSSLPPLPLPSPSPPHPPTPCLHRIPQALPNVWLWKLQFILKHQSSAYHPCDPAPCPLPQCELKPPTLEPNTSLLQLLLSQKIFHSLSQDLLQKPGVLHLRAHPWGHQKPFLIPDGLYSSHGALPFHFPQRTPALVFFDLVLTLLYPPFSRRKALIRNPGQHLAPSWSSLLPLCTGAGPCFVPGMTSRLLSSLL